MPYASLYQKYRPQTFSEIIGQPHVARTLANSVERGHIFHAYLFSGPRGTGKTSTARILAKAVNCDKGPTSDPCGICQQCKEIAAGTFPDVFEIDAATHSKVEETRDFLSNVPTGLSALSRKKFYIIDEVHMLSSHAFNALLKTLEEPPDHVVFVLATTEPHKVPPTIAGRCQHFEFRLIPPSELAAHYKKICEKEGIEFEPEAVERVATLARGSARDGLSLMDQLVAASGGRLTLESVTSVIGDDEIDISAELAQAIATGDLERCLELSTKISESGKDFRAFTRRFASYLRNLMIASYLPASKTRSIAGVDAETATRLSDTAKLLGRPTILRCIDIVGEVLASMAAGSPPQLELELGLVRMCRPEESPTPGELAKQIQDLAAKLARIEQRATLQSQRGVSSERLSEAPAFSSRASHTEGDHGSKPEKSDRDRESAPAKKEDPGPAPIDESDLERLWNRFLDMLKAAKKMKARAILLEATAVRIRESRLEIDFPQRLEFHAKNAESLASALEEQMVSVFGRPLKIVSRLVPESPPASRQDRIAGEKENEDSRLAQESAPASVSLSSESSENEGEGMPDERKAHELAERLIMNELGGTPIPE